MTRGTWTTATVPAIEMTMTNAAVVDLGTAASHTEKVEENGYLVLDLQEEIILDGEGMLDSIMNREPRAR
jgi:hypothetical protein